MTKRGLFITFEGIDGAGKSTHIAAVADAFRQAGREVVCTREPGGTPLAEQLRQMVLSAPMDALTETLLMFAGRRDHLQIVIEPALARGAVVLCDRFTDATFAYQGAGRGFDREVLAALERWVQKMPADAGEGVRQPDLTLLFQIDPAVAARRLAGARLPDRFEVEPQAFFARVAAGYAERASAEPGRFARIDAAAAPEDVRAQAVAAVRSRNWTRA